MMYGIRLSSPNGGKSNDLLVLTTDKQHRYC